MLAKNHSRHTRTRFYRMILWSVQAVPMAFGWRQWHLAAHRVPNSVEQMMHFKLKSNACVAMAWQDAPEWTETLRHTRILNVKDQQWQHTKGQVNLAPSAFFWTEQAHSHQAFIAICQNWRMAVKWQSKSLSHNPTYVENNTYFQCIMNVGMNCIWHSYEQCERAKFQ